MSSQVFSRFYTTEPSEEISSLNRVKSFFSNSASLIQRIFYENSLFFALDNQAISNKYLQYKDLSWTQKFKLGAIKGVEHVLTTTPIIFALNFFIRGGINVLGGDMKMSPEKSDIYEGPSIIEGVAAAVYEEILFRGVLHNLLADYQKIFLTYANHRVKNNHVFKWLTSPSARIVSINALFAASHLFNVQGELQSLRIMMQPAEGILYETTGNIGAPIACHMTNNILAFTLSLF